MKVSLVAALASNRVIGKGNQLPWHIPQDLKRFRMLTSGGTVLMGRKTYESIGKPLPNRTNWVISRSSEFRPAEGVRVFSSLESAWVEAERLGIQELFVIGGGEIYRQALARADRLLLTEVHGDIEGDAFFPEWNSVEFRETARERHEAGAMFPFSFVTLERA